MYQYTEFDRQFVRARAAQYRDQLERWLAGKLSDDEFRPLRLQNGWYVQRYAPMLRIAVPYGEISSAQLRVLAKIAREYDQPDAELLQERRRSSRPWARAGAGRRPPVRHHLKCGYGHFTTRTNVQFNWIPLAKSGRRDGAAGQRQHARHPDQRQRIRNITTDELAGIAVDEIADPRPFAEILRQWSTLHPEFAFLPRKFKIALNGAKEDRAALGWYDIGLQLVQNEAGEMGFRVLVGGGMGRTPIIGTVVREFLPWQQILNYLEACIRVYNRYGRRDNVWKARIKILVKAEGQRYIDQVEEEFRQIVESDGALHTITQAELRPRGRLVRAAGAQAARDAPMPACTRSSAPTPKPTRSTTAGCSATCCRTAIPAARRPLSFKRLGQAPGDATADQLDAAADLADRFSAGEARVTHEQNLLLPWVHQDDLPELWAAGAQAGPGARQHRPDHRHDRLPRRRLLLAGQCALAADRRSDHRALPGPRRGMGHRRDRPEHLRLHQLLRPPPRRPHRHPRRRQGRQGVVPGHAGRLQRLRPVRPRHARQDRRPVVLRRRSAGGDRGRARHLPPRAPGRRRRQVRNLHRHAAPRGHRALQGRRQCRPLRGKGNRMIRRT